MVCPMGYGVGLELEGLLLPDDEEAVVINGRDEEAVVIKTGEDLLLGTETGEDSQRGVNKSTLFSDQVSYSSYLQLDKLLSCQELRSKEANKCVPDEHLFIITHQTYELWFKQIIFDIDLVRKLLHNKHVDETKTLQIVSLLERTAKILKLLVDQMLILETMSPLDFVEFRKYLTSASGFQSLQFRLLENKLGVRVENRVRYNRQHYKEVFTDGGPERRTVCQSELEPSLFELVDRWLSRTPGIYISDDEIVKNNDVIGSVYKKNKKEKTELFEAIKSKDAENHVLPSRGISETDEGQTVQKRNGWWNLYRDAVRKYLGDMRLGIEEEGVSEEERELKREEYLKTERSFSSITDEREYEILLERGECRLSLNALKGALMIYFYRDMPRFSQPYQILINLMDIDSLLQKWRYNHVMLVQRMIGSKQGTGGSSGYLYLRTTVSDRYKVFLDLFNLSTWLIPRVYIPKLSPKMVKTLSELTGLAAGDQ